MVNRGDIWIADLNPIQGSVQSGVRPVIIFQNSIIAQYSSTIIIIPLTSNLRRADLPTCLKILADSNGLDEDSVALCHQIRAIDKSRLKNKIGSINSSTMIDLESVVLFSLGFD